jgi:tetratricopeptide (TPR) repeat protein
MAEQTVATGSSDRASALALRDRAFLLHERGELYAAEQAYREVLRRLPLDYEVMHALGALVVQTGAYAEAVRLIEPVIRHQETAAAHADLGNAFLGLTRLEDALRSFDRANELNPGVAHVHLNRGHALRGLGRAAAALASYDTAIAAQPDFFEAHVSRADLLLQIGRWQEALSSLDRAISLRPDSTATYLGRATALLQLNRYDEAIADYDRVIQYQPESADAYLGRGIALKARNLLLPALASLDRAIEIKDDCPEAYYNRGNLLTVLRQFDAACASYDQALAINPEFAEAHFNRGNLLAEQRRFDAAIASYGRAIAIKADYAEAYCNRGNVLRELDRSEAAVASYDQAIAIRSDYAEAYSNRGVVLTELQQVHAALASYNQAIAVNPDYAQAYFNRSTALLLNGDFEQGWTDYEWRWKHERGVAVKASRNLRQPLWLGSQSLAGKSILLHSEQGLGDTIQFCRYATLVADLGAFVVLEVPASLEGLLTSLNGVSALVTQGQALPECDYQCPLMSLPLAFRTTLSGVPADVPYLRASVEKVRPWREKLGERRKPRVGLVWSGGFRPDQPEVWAANRRRNIPLAKLASLKGADIEFYSLQKGQPAESELAELLANKWDGPAVLDYSSHLQDFSDTAALIDQLDLVISVDTSTAHVAGAMGKPLWILNRFDTCWRWLMHGNDSPWYPTAKLYRQERAGDWDGVIRRVRSDLMALVR